MSNENRKIALVNEADEIVGFANKQNIHRDGLLHRAFSILVFNDQNEVLLQKRASSKYHSPSLWTNTCCSHLVEDCDFETYIHERLLDEMGFDCELEFKFAFHYRVEFENGLCENEIDHVYFGIWNGLPKPNITEVDDFEWISFEHLKSIISDNPDKYTYWFKELISRVQLK